MKRTGLVIALSMVLVTGISGGALATTLTFSPIDKTAPYTDLNDLDHNYVYLWGIKWTLPEGQHITGATLTFKNIYDWINEPNDVLSVNLLDGINSAGWSLIASNGSTTWQKADYQSTAAVTWPADAVTHVGSWSDPNGGSPRNFDLVFDLAQLGFLDELEAYASPSAKLYNFGFGFDPDCHYYNNGIELKITVPEPGSMGLIVLGFVGLAAIRRRAAA